MNKIELRNLIETYPNKITDLRKTIGNFMENCSTEYPTDWKLFQKIYHELYLEKQTTIPLCPVCSGPLRFTGLRGGYTQSCSASCRNRNPEFLKKYKDACLAKYGTEFASQSAEFRDIVKATNISKYGVDNPFKSKQVRNKHKETCIEKYGVDNPSKSEQVIDKIKKSRVASGDWIADSDRSDLELYRIAVKKVSAKSYHDHYYKINPDNLPRSRYKYHLDHIFSVEEGFKQGVPTEVIGHWTNLRMLWHLDNSVKNTKCHKTLEKLMEDYHSASNSSSR
jgi:hypothetical protein